MAVAAAGLGFLLLLDVVLGVKVFDVVLPALVGDLAVIGAVAVAVTAPPRTIQIGAVVGSAASVAVSLAVYVTTSDTRSLMMGFGAWPGFAELAGLALLTAWSVRSSSRNGAITAISAFGIVMLAIIQWRNKGTYSEVLTLASGHGLGGRRRRRVVPADSRRPPTSTGARGSPPGTSGDRRELHDVVAHHVTGIVVQAQAAQLVAAEHPDAAQRALDRIVRAGGDALAAMRSMVGALRDESTDAELDPAASIDALRAMANMSVTDRHELPVRLAVDARTEAVPGTVIASIHRIAREAVTNARRHSVGATNIDIDVRCGDGVVAFARDQRRRPSEPLAGRFRTAWHGRTCCGDGR